jgi:hypothetical protein
MDPTVRLLSQTHQLQINNKLNFKVSWGESRIKSVLTLLAILPLHPVAIHTHSKPTPRAYPVQVEDGSIAHITHFSNTFDSSLPSNLSCKNQKIT